MTTLRPTPTRLALMCAVRNAAVEYDPEARRFVRYADGRVVETVTHDFNALRLAGLVRLIGATNTEVTDPVGLDWLAAHDDEGNPR